MAHFKTYLRSLGNADCAAVSSGVADTCAAALFGFRN